MSTSLPLSRVRAFLALPPDALVRVHTLQHPAAVEAAKARGYLTCDADHVFDEDDRDEDGRPTGFLKAYEWMRARMAERIPDFSGDLPTFCWLKRPSTKPLPAGFGQMVRLTALVPRRRLLASWHNGFLTVGNDWAGAFRPYGEERDEEATPDEIEASYLRLFDVADPAFWRKDKVYGGDEIQVCADRIHMNEIVGVHPVPTKPRRAA